MFYTNKRDKSEVVELIYSDSLLTVVIDQEDSLMKGEPVGRIIKKNKKQFKKDYEKSSGKFIRMSETPKEKIEFILNTIMPDKHGIINHTQEYVDRKNYLDRVEYFNSISDEDYNDNLKRYADPVVKKKRTTRKDLLNAKEKLISMEQ